MKILYSFIFLVTLLFSHNNAVAKKIYLSKLSPRDNTAIEQIFKDVILRCDSVNRYRKYSFEVVINKYNDTLLLDFAPVIPKEINGVSKPKGFIEIHNRYFFIYCDDETNKIFNASSKKHMFVIADEIKHGVGYINGPEWFYITTGTAYNKLTFLEWSDCYNKLEFHRIRLKKKNNQNPTSSNRDLRTGRSPNCGRRKRLVI